MSDYEDEEFEDDIVEDLDVCVTGVICQQPDLSTSEEMEYVRAGFIAGMERAAELCKIPQEYLMAFDNCNAVGMLDGAVVCKKAILAFLAKR